MPIRIEVPPPPWLRVGCLLAFAAFLVQLFVFDEPRILAQLMTIVWDKLMHAIAFGTLATMLWFVLGFDAPALSWLLVTAIGAVDEFHQIFIPGRTADLFDAGSIGRPVVGLGDSGSELACIRLSVPGHGPSVDLDVIDQLSRHTSFV